MVIKDATPINLMIYQSELESIQFALGEAIKICWQHDANQAGTMLHRAKDDIQRKIEIHKRRGEWA